MQAMQAPISLLVMGSILLGVAAPDTQGQEDPPVASSEATEPEEQESRGLKFEEQVVVTAGKTEQRLRDLPVHATVLTKEDIRRSPAQTVADVLREVPSFNLNGVESTRMGSHPGSAVSLRSLGGGAASRALVLLDGVPLNDAFFGWIPWSRVSRASVERIEVIPAGGAGAWGNQALGGVIQILTRRPEQTAVELDTRLGSLGTTDLDLGASFVRGPVSFSPRVTYFDTEGYVLLSEDDRGPVDAKGDSESKVLEARLEYNPSPGARWTLQGSYLDDDRTIGTALSQDHVEVATVRGGVDLSTPGGSSLRVNAFGLWREGWSVRTSINGDRTAEVPNRNQFDIPSSTVGAGLSWSRLLSARHLLSAGADLQHTEGELHDDSRFLSGAYTRRSITGGKQVLLGFYAQDTALLGSRWRAVAGGRLDLWHPYGGTDFLQDLSSGAVLKDEHFPSRTEWIFNPNLGLRFQASDRLGLRGSVYRTFRAPTPNELYRAALLGSRNVNSANANLDPERVTVGFEAGFDYAVTNTFSTRVTGFLNEVDGAIVDVTLRTAGSTAEEIPPCGLLPAGATCRQKQNLDRVRHRGAEVEIELRPDPVLRFSAAYTYALGTVSQAPNAPQLVGNRLRGMPEHKLSLRAEYANPRVLTASLLGRYMGDSYQDDLNLVYIEDWFVLDLFVSRRLGQKFELYAAAENLLDTDFMIDLGSDGTEYGHPRMLHAGVRFRWQDGGTAASGP
jgi:outer membrane receptor protein involved in Fe transport